jgi:hypothetical protein
VPVNRRAPQGESFLAALAVFLGIIAFGWLLSFVAVPLEPRGVDAAHAVVED